MASIVKFRVDRQILFEPRLNPGMVDIAALFGIGFLAVTLLMTAALTYLGLAEGEFTGTRDGSDEDGDEAASGA